MLIDNMGYPIGIFTLEKDLIMPTPSTLDAVATSNKAINSKITAIKRNALKMNDEIQAVIVLVIEHTAGVGNGDCTGAARLVDALPMTHRRALIINYFAQYSPIRVSKTSKGEIKAHLAREGTEGYTPFDIDGARANRWDAQADVNREPGLMTIEDAEDKVKSLAEAIRRKISRNQVAPADIARLTKLANDIEGVHENNLATGPAPKLNDKDKVKGEPKTEREEKGEALGGARTGTNG